MFGGKKAMEVEPAKSERIPRVKALIPFQEVKHCIEKEDGTTFDRII